MIDKLNELKSNSNSPQIRELCESTINTLTSAIYAGVSEDARHEIEKLSMESLFEKLSTIKDDKYASTWLKNQKRIYAVKNIGVRDAINSLHESEGKHNPLLADVLDTYEGRLATTPEVLLYEEFIGSMKNFVWMPSVERSIKAINENVTTYGNDVSISKILEEMKLTRSNYLVPLIEDVVNDYLNNKTEETKHILKETLVKFSYDEYVRSIINIAMQDSVSLQLEYASANADIETVYSPLKYLGENEVMFNIKGTYYVKKGNNVNRIKNADVQNIDPKFRSVCEAVNHPYVEISKKDIKVYLGKDKAVINEDSITLNDHKMNINEFKAFDETAAFRSNNAIYELANVLSENFDEIAEVDFVKRVCLKENAEHAADVFKLRENICITTYDPVNNKVTFYRNINPIQAEKIMMEHMRFDVSSTFKDILPNKDKILNQINETKQSYIDYINELGSKITDLQSQGTSKTITMAVEAINEELSEVKNEYKDYVNNVEKYTNVSEGITLSLDVDGKKYTIPIPQADAPTRGAGDEIKGEAGTEVSAEDNTEPSSQVTFDSDESELLGQNPSMDSDRVDLGTDEIEAAADAAEAAQKEEGEEDQENAGDEATDLNLDNLDLDDESNDETAPEETEDGEEVKKPTKKEESEEEDENAKQLNDDADPKLAKTPLSKKPKAEVKDGDVKSAPKKKLFLKKKKLQESIHINLKKKLNECGLGDAVMYKNQKGYVTGENGDGSLIVQIQGRTVDATPDELDLVGKKKKTMDVPFKFDKVTLKALREQYVKCGIYMNSVPIKINECYVNYDEWDNSRDDQFLNVVIEGRSNMMQKNSIRILENVNDFANPDNYVPGMIVDETTGAGVENVLVNAIDYTHAVGDTDQVRIIRRTEGNQVPDTVPAAIVKTLSV